MRTILAIGCLLVMGCQRSPDQLADHYKFIHQTSAGADEIEQVLAQLPYTKIEFERSGCYGSCPVFQAVFHVDSTATYEGERFVEREGNYQGTINAWDYTRLCCLIDRLKLNVSASYSVDSVDLSGCTLRVTKRTGQVIEISDYGEQGPIELWALQQCIDNVITRTTWHPIEVPQQAGPENPDQ